LRWEDSSGPPPCPEPGTELVVIVGYPRLWLCPAHARELRAVLEPVPADEVAEPWRVPVQEAIKAGFAASGLGAHDPCPDCGHRWGGHLLCAPGDSEPAMGGWIECDRDDCSCWSTFDFRPSPPGS
jgi:hypothetical protein